MLNADDNFAVPSGFVGFGYLFAVMKLRLCQCKSWLQKQGTHKTVGSECPECFDRASANGRDSSLVSADARIISIHDIPYVHQDSLRRRTSTFPVGSQ